MDVDLIRGVVPISKAASGLAALIRRATRENRPIIITQKGSPSAVLLSVERYVQLAATAEGAAGHRPVEALPFTPPWGTGGADEQEG